MKKQLVLSAILCSFFTVYTLAQQRIVLEVSDVKSDNPQAIQSMAGATQTVEFNGNVVENEVSMMSNSMQVQRIFNAGNGSTQLFFNLMGQKVQVSVPDSALNARLSEREENSNIEYFPNDTKQIQGYNCYKTVVESLREDGSVRIFTLYITDDIKAPAYAIAGLPRNLKGFPLEYTMNVNGTEIVYALKEISNELSADFAQAPEGYEEMPYADFEVGLGKKFGF